MGDSRKSQTSAGRFFAKNMRAICLDLLWHPARRSGLDPLGLDPRFLNTDFHFLQGMRMVRPSKERPRTFGESAITDGWADPDVVVLWHRKTAGTTLQLDAANGETNDPAHAGAG